MQSFPPMPAAPVAATPTAMSPQEAFKRSQIAKTAKDFEASFLSVMINSMFEGVSTDGPMGGGEAEQTMRSFMTDAFSKGMAKHGGIGLAPSIRAQMLKLQGLS